MPVPDFPLLVSCPTFSIDKKIYTDVLAIFCWRFSDVRDSLAYEHLSSCTGLLRTPSVINSLKSPVDPSKVFVGALQGTSCDTPFGMLVEITNQPLESFCRSFTQYVVRHIVRHAVERTIVLTHGNVNPSRIYDEIDLRFHQVVHRVGFHGQAFCLSSQVLTIRVRDVFASEPANRTLVNAYDRGSNWESCCRFYCHIIPMISLRRVPFQDKGESSARVRVFSIGVNHARLSSSVCQETRSMYLEAQEF